MQEERRPPVKQPRGAPVALETERFRLRTLEPVDVGERMRSWMADAEIMSMVTGRAYEVSLDHLRRRVSQFDNRRRFMFGIFTRDPVIHIGNLTLFCDPENLTAQTNIVVGEREWWGRNIVPETRAAVLDFAFEKLGIEKVWGVPFARNFPALYNYKTQGFTCEGILRANKRLPDGTRVATGSYNGQVGIYDAANGKVIRQFVPVPLE